MRTRSSFLLVLLASGVFFIGLTFVTRGHERPAMVSRPQLPGAALPELLGRPGPAALDPHQVVEVARAWVTDRFTRKSGAGPFSWLAAVEPFTDPQLLARLRQARPTPDDLVVVASTVEIDGVYPDALDPATVTVTCVEHEVTASGPRLVPRAVTLRLVAGADSTPIVAGDE